MASWRWSIFVNMPYLIGEHDSPTHFPLVYVTTPLSDVFQLNAKIVTI